MKNTYFAAKLCIFCYLVTYFGLKSRIGRFFNRKADKLKKSPEWTRYAAIQLAKTMRHSDLKKVIHFLCLVDTYGRCTFHRKIESRWDDWGTMIYRVYNGREVFYFELLRPSSGDRNDWRPLLPMRNVFDGGEME